MHIKMAHRTNEYFPTLEGSPSDQHEPSKFQALPSPCKLAIVCVIDLPVPNQVKSVASYVTVVVKPSNIHNSAN